MRRNKLFERIIDEASFYKFVSEELHGLKGVQVTSNEPDGGEFSCFDYSHEGDDVGIGEYSDSPQTSGIHEWLDCELTMDDDGLYWESKSGKNACLLIYSITKTEAKPEYVDVWVAPINGSGDFGKVTFRCDCDK